MIWGGDAAKQVVSEGLVIGHSSRFQAGSEEEDRSEAGWEETLKSRAHHVIVIPDEVLIR